MTRNPKGATVVSRHMSRLAASLVLVVCLLALVQRHRRESARGAERDAGPRRRARHRLSRPRRGTLAGTGW